MRDSFSTFFPNLKIFLHSFAFLDFSMQIYFQQANWLDGFFGLLLSVGQQIGAVSKFISPNVSKQVKV
jgi:hypothetical protein